MADQETTIAIIALVAVVVLLLVWLFAQKRRTDTLRDHFGEEYDRTLAARGGRADAEADLIEREKRAKDLEIRALTPAERDRFAGEWSDTKTLFVDSPIEAVGRADRVLTEILTTRGYPMADFERRHADLTVGHREVARHYLAGHEIADRASEATTEELRRAFNHYEALFDDLTSDTTGRAADFESQPRAPGDESPARPAAFSTTTTKPEG